MKNGIYRLLELDEDKKRAYLCSASKEEIDFEDYPNWTYEKRNQYNTDKTDKKLRKRAEKRGYKVLPPEVEEESG